MVEGEEWQTGISICKDVEIVAKVPAVTGGIPADRAIRLREISIAVTVEVAGFATVTGMVRTEAGSGDNRSTVAGDVQTSGIELTTPDGFIQEAGAKYGKQ